MGMRQLSFSICQAHLVQRKSSDTDLSRTRLNLVSHARYDFISVVVIPLFRLRHERTWGGKQGHGSRIAMSELKLALGKMSECVHRGTDCGS
ncbi:uncharacterized protein BO88DRAFT_450989 [Aspergillus vadensis CBS 113365]|uniref:Uncharacterized protein n=1 Tax=Aspergillus vadensis (strain CBS 113365 / IMI 142717 / IBT 24658) TaxID=1448311 RepID=A0A319BMQ9_ASPVC|nr:hypothetical protein BO88DRAFT_450989 [Aspergillus vadensis CBS 113365]PYH72400.1 hypothetical protein BO88DRAFT_450989 [Aspergillus vadensis CBS 113365]